MKIEDKNIILDNQAINLGMSYAEVESKIATRIYTKRSLNEKNMGHIIVEHEEFYGLKGSCVFTFSKEDLPLLI